MRKITANEIRQIIKEELNRARKNPDALFEDYQPEGAAKTLRGDAKKDILRRVYDELSGDPMARGSATMTFTVKEDGKLSEVEVDEDKFSALEDGPMSRLFKFKDPKPEPGPYKLVISLQSSLA
jgi:hypothetical protein